MTDDNELKEIIEIAKDIYNGTVIDPTKLPKEALIALIKAINTNSDKIINIAQSLQVYKI